jgi:RNA polymerase sigma-70 factor (ECF subfamily)
MHTVDEFAEAFLSRWRSGGTRAEPPELLDALSRARERAVSASPSFCVAPKVLGEVVAARLESAPEPASALARLNIEELCLAIACGEGDAAALEVFETRYAPDMRSTLERLGFDSATVDEVAQNVREMLFVAGVGRRPGILGFRGHGQLRAWLRAVVSRTAFRLSRGRRPAVAFNEATHAIAGKDDIELEYLKKTYGHAFEEAFRDALALLPIADRLLLKQRFRLQMTVAELGELHAVNASTVSRWVADARDRLVISTRKIMMKRLGLRPADMSSILRLIESRVEVSLTTLIDRDVRQVSG